MSQLSITEQYIPWIVKNYERQQHVQQQQEATRHAFSR